MPPQAARRSGLGTTPTSGRTPPDDPGQVAAQRQPVLQHAVRITEELDLAHPDLGGARSLLGFPDRAALGGVEGIDTGLAGGHQRIPDGLAGTVHAATALAVPYSRSSGCAAMHSADDQSSGNGIKVSAMTTFSGWVTAVTSGNS